MAGYSQTPLARKLGIKDGFIIRLIHQPEYYFDLFIDLPENITVSTNKKIKKDLIHYFAEQALDMQRDMPALKNEIKEDGVIWISWYKKASKIPTDITEDVIRESALSNGLVDIKVCAIDVNWSGLKLVIPVKNRKVIK